MLFASRTLSPLQSKASTLQWCQGGISDESNAGEVMGGRERENWALHNPQQCLPVKHLQHPFLYISHQVKKKEGKGKDEGTGRPDPVNSMADQQKEKATALPADKKNQSPDTSPGDFLSALLQ